MAEGPSTMPTFANRPGVMACWDTTWARPTIPATQTSTPSRIPAIKTPSRFAASDPTPVFPLGRLHEGQEERALLERLDLVLESRFEYDDFPGPHSERALTGAEHHRTGQDVKRQQAA